MSPVDLVRLRQELAARQQVSPEQRRANLRQTAEEALGVLPVIGNVLSARDAITSAGDTGAALGEGRYRDAAGNALLTGIGALGAVTGLPWGRGAREAAATGRDTASAFDVWHGSPHKFTDEFRMDKLGTGEGAQVYGHGLYFAGSPKVAEHYQNQLGELRIGDRIPESGFEEMAAMQKIRGRLDDVFVRNWEANLNRAIASGDAVAEAEARRALAAAQVVRESDVRKHGYKYGVTVDAEPEDLLDLDLPLSKQSPKVQEAIRKLGYEPVDYFDGHWLQKEIWRHVDDDVNENHWGMPGYDVDAMTSKKLHDAGIIGSQYFDSMSRDKGEGTRNYVIWDDSKLKVNSRTDSYGNPFANGGRALRLERYANGGRVAVGGIRGDTGGRADALAVNVPAGAYVIPADVVAALGQGNTDAGMARLEQQFGRPAFARGGEVVPIQISHGEFVVSPEQVAAAGGADALDGMVKEVRRMYARHLQSIPGPRNGNE